MQGTFALSYLVQLALSRIAGFFAHWYGDGSKNIFAAYRMADASLENTFATRAMLHLLFRPLYGDYSVVGRIIGPVFRISRLAIGLAMRLVFTLAFLAAWLAWSAIPPLVAAYAAGLLHR